MTESGAVFSECKRYRYHLWRTIGGSRGRVSFVMLNPSTATETTNDPTVRRCIGFAQLWGFSRLDVLNIFAWRSTNPEALYCLEDPIGPENDATIMRITASAELVICAWGKHGALRGRGRQVQHMLGPKAKALWINNDGSPKHPLYLKADLEPIPFGSEARATT